MGYTDMGILLKDPDKQQCLLYTSTSLQNLCLKITFVLNMLPLAVVLTFSLNFQVESVPGEF